MPERERKRERDGGREGRARCLPNRNTHLFHRRCCAAGSPPQAPNLFLLYLRSKGFAQTGANAERERKRKREKETEPAAGAGKIACCTSEAKTCALTGGEVREGEEERSPVRLTG